MSTELEVEDWSALTDFLAGLSEIPTQDIEAQRDYVLGRACELVDARGGTMFFAVREPSALGSAVQRATTQILEWRPYELIYHGRTDEYMKAVNAYTRSERPAVDKGVQAMAAMAGVHRSLITADLPPEFMQRARKEETVLRAGASDRMVCVHSHNENIELYFCLDRIDAEQLYFDARDRDMMAAMMPRLTPFVYRYCLSLGLFVGQGMEALTPRERETLLGLLGPLPEKELAEQMGLTPRSMHQYVLRVYQKLGVNSRAELTAMWLDLPKRKA